MFAVIVTFQINPSDWAAFMPAMRANAATSLADEGGCHRFDVCTDPAHPNEVFLYELYTDRAAFDVHLASAHFKTFDALVAPMIASKSAATYAQVTS
ncbi:putative quinol monooxygenase [Loktanella sp. Alg231-35]|uniref:putative quinol monooxygenase n=1 Tax=Loktanella sp. Alg231-35 TaxID=1922220 RepID=UPI000D55FC9C|nr:putative quinol monooxygenase [Loktanella sp. Alg231-35]